MDLPIYLMGLGLVLAVASSAFLDDLLEGRPLRTPDFLVAAVVATATALLLVLVRRSVRARHETLAELAETQIRLRREAESTTHAYSTGFARALDVRDRYTGAHSDQVVELTTGVGRRLGFGPKELQRLGMAARLHDLGKLGVPDHILHKPGPLDEEEWEVMQQHPLWGSECLAGIEGLEDIAAVIRTEHEHWDGSGYPYGLAGKQIPRAARIILACDAYHAMISNRPYRDAVSTEEAIIELRANAGTQFDPQVVETLCEVLESNRSAAQVSDQMGGSLPST